MAVALRLQLVRMYEVEALEINDHYEKYFTQNLTTIGLCNWIKLQQQKGEESPIKIISFKEVKPIFQEVSQFDFFSKK